MQRQFNQITAKKPLENHFKVSGVTVMMMLMSDYVVNGLLINDKWMVLLGIKKLEFITRSTSATLSDDVKNDQNDTKV